MGLYRVRKIKKVKYHITELKKLLRSPTLHKKLGQDQCGEKSFEGSPIVTHLLAQFYRASSVPVARQGRIEETRQPYSC